MALTEAPREGARMTTRNARAAIAAPAAPAAPLFRSSAAPSFSAALSFAPHGSTQLFRHIAIPPHRTTRFIRKSAGITEFPLYHQIGRNSRTSRRDLITLNRPSPPIPDRKSVV